MSENPLNDISLSLEKTLINSDLIQINIDLAEVSLDQLFDNGILRDIPVISTLVGVSRTTQTIRNHLFLKKMIYFISCINTIPQKEREEVINEIDQSKEFRIKVAEKLLYIIDKSEDHKSAEIIAKLFSAFLKREIKYSDFLKASMIVNNIFTDDLIHFVNDKQEYHHRADDVSELLNSGLFDIEVEEFEVNVEDQDDYKSSGKYKTSVAGGELKANISSIGRIIKKVLKNQL